MSFLKKPSFQSISATALYAIFLACTIELPCAVTDSTLPTEEITFSFFYAVPAWNISTPSIDFALDRLLITLFFL